MMTKKGMIFVSSLVVTLCLGLISDAGAQKVDKIKIGLMYGLTGAGSPIGPVQMEGSRLAVKDINEAGGVKIGDKKVPVEIVQRDDETKPDVALRRLRELVFEDKVHAIVGSTFAAISAALNKEVKKTPIPYFSVCVAPMTMFKKDELADTTFGVHGGAYAIGFAGAAYIINKLGYKNIYFFAPAYAFGWDQKAGAKDAIEKYGAKWEYAESPVGTPDFTPYLLKIAEKKPDIVMMAHWGVDAINVLKQAHEIGLKKNTRIWFNWMTNVFGGGIPPEALEGVNSLMSWYWNMAGFNDPAIVRAADEFVNKYIKEYNYPPDPYAAIAYVGVKEAVRGIELAKSTDPNAITKAIMDNPKFNSMRGPGIWRADHQPLFKYGSFIVVGKSPKEKKDKWDLVKVLGAYTGEDYLPPLKELGY
ncbi:MAG TPA: ABC transporter substrate-binding protein [Thermodesulfobacteriota bacterium]|nr:ABC transporter substrate-binding protein [Thermodesulfobacteriota bacterium]